jgi:outer membrane lipase/esterase
MEMIISTVLLVGPMLLMSTSRASGQGLNDVINRALRNNCHEIGGPAASVANNQQGPLDRLCAFAGATSSGGGGASPTVDTRLGESQEQRRQAERLAERRAGRGGSADQAGSGFGLFVNGDYQFLNKDNTRFETGFEQHTAGTTVGLDYAIRGRGVLGVALNYAHEFGDFAGVSGGFDNDLYGATFYGTIVPIDNLFVDGFVGYTRKEYSIARRVNFVVEAPGADPTRVALGRIDGNTHSDEFHVGATTGYDFILRNFTLGPRVGVNYSDSRIAGFEERGSTGVELVYKNQNIISLTTTAGVFASMAISTKFGVLVPQATAEYVHEFENDQRSVGFAFSGSTLRSQLRFQTDPPDRNFFNFGLGAVFVLPGGMSTFVNVRELVGYSTRRATNVTAGLRLAF